MNGFLDGVFLFSDFIWGGSWGDTRILPIGVIGILLLGAGLYFMLGLKGRPLRRLVPAVNELWSGRKAQGDGEITPWQALSTALSGQVGTGNLAGVATAISVGGPGAIFWMWVTALLGMAAAFAESSLAVRFREKHPDGHYHGGPMYYIKNGLGKRWRWLAVWFCLGTLFSASFTGGMIQSNSIANVMSEATRSFAGDLPCALTSGKTAVEVGDDEVAVIINGCAIENALANNTTVPVTAAGAPVEADPTTFTREVKLWIPGLIICAAVFIVIIGGIKSIGSVAGKVVPFMAAFYIACALFVLITHIDKVPLAFAQIFAYAFGFQEAVGGVAGYGVLQAVRFGIARGLFSNEAGQGSAPIAHAAAQTRSPVMQGEIAMIGVFVDTIIICTMTALAILVVTGDFTSGATVVEYAWQSSTLQGPEITSAVYREGLPFGEVIIAVALTLFAFTTILGWSYYAEQALTYLVGDWATRPFRFVWVGVVFVGTLFVDVNQLFRLGDIANASMAFPNLIAILGLSGVVFAMVRRPAEHAGESVKDDAS
ncbi:MAG: alanine:cation symporter family protein [Caulobacterales bacterium]|nr:alanine:cation symporter family protein [Caulobacterales bacterium]